MKKILCIVLTLVCIVSIVGCYPEYVAAASEKEILHKETAAQGNIPIKYNFSLAKGGDLNLDIRINASSGVNFTILNQQNESTVMTDYLSSLDSNWKYDKSHGIYSNKHKIHLDAGEYILEMRFDADLKYNFTMTLLSNAAKLNASKISITKGFTKTIKVSNGKIKSCSSTNEKVATVTNKGKITAKSNGKAKIKVKLTNGKTLTCTVTVKSNTYSREQLTISDTLYERYALKAYSATFDSKGNLVIRFTIANNRYGKMTEVPNLKITVTDANKNTVASYSKASYQASVDSYKSANFKVTIPKSKLKKAAGKIDLRTCKYKVSGKDAISIL